MSYIVERASLRPFTLSMYIESVIKSAENVQHYLQVLVLIHHFKKSDCLGVEICVRLQKFLYVSLCSVK